MEQVKIEYEYVREAMNIMQRYDELIIYIKNYEDLLKEHNVELLKTQKEIENLKKLTMPDQEKEKKVYEFFVHYDRQLQQIQDKIKPQLDELEDLKVQSEKLYRTLKVKYPMTDEDLKKALVENIELVKKGDLK